MIGYTKLFASIIASTIWGEDDATRVVWITMLAMAGKGGIVEASVPGLAAMSRVSVDDCRAAISKLEAPDPDSRTPDKEGRRIEKVDGGWTIINHAKYRAKMGADERREYLRLKKQESRAKSKGQHGVNNCPAPSTPSTHAEAETEAEAAKAPAAPAVPAEGSEGPIAVTSEHTKFIADWCAYYLLRSKVKYPFTARDAKAVKQLLKHFGSSEKAKAFIKECHRRQPEGYPFTASETLYDLANGLARLEAALAKPPAARNGRSTPPPTVAIAPTDGSIVE